MNIKKYKKNKGMTYIELIVVLSIFGVMSTVVLFSNQKFQAKVDMKNLANDIALKITEAQKSAISGKFPNKKHQQALIDYNIKDWVPSYGVSFSLNNNSSFYSFADLNSDKVCDDGYFCKVELIDTFNIAKGNSIKNIMVYYNTIEERGAEQLQNVHFTFKRPNNEVTITSATEINGPISYIELTLYSPQDFLSIIKVYPSGRIQIN